MYHTISKAINILILIIKLICQKKIYKFWPFQVFAILTANILECVIFIFCNNLLTDIFIHKMYKNANKSLIPLEICVSFSGLKLNTLMRVQYKMAGTVK